jgi:hypothetical protein
VQDANMQTIQRAPPAHNPCGSRYAYFDTVELFFRKYPRGLTMLARERDVQVHDCKDRRGELCGYRLVVHQPTLRSLQILDEMQVEQEGVLCRYDLALDLIEDDPEAMKDWLATHVCLKHRPSNPMHDEIGTTYWISRVYQSQKASRVERKHKRRSRPRRDIALYPQDCSRVTGEIGVVHLELRFLCADAVKRTKVTRVRGLLKINPRELYAKHIRLYEFDEDAFVQKMQRAAVRADRKSRRGTHCHPVVDKFRASIPRRIKGFVKRFGQGRVQLLRDMFKIPVTPISLDVLRVPHGITNHQHRPSSSKNMCNFNDADMHMR